jgi:hypothetical protein
VSGPRVRSSRLARVATVLMIVLGLLSILVSVTIAAILIALGIAMLLFEWWLKRKFSRVPSD